jgi:hypothetical protein
MATLIKAKPGPCDAAKEEALVDYYEFLAGLRRLREEIEEAAGARISAVEVNAAEVIVDVARIAGLDDRHIMSALEIDYLPDGEIFYPADNGPEFDPLAVTCPACGRPLTGIGGRCPYCCAG